MARQGGVKIGGAADPATSPVSGPGLRHVTLLPRHHAWCGVTIGAVKNVSFEKNSIRFKISLQKMLKLKKNPGGHTRQCGKDMAHGTTVKAIYSYGSLSYPGR